MNAIEFERTIHSKASPKYSVIHMGPEIQPKMYIQNEVYYPNVVSLTGNSLEEIHDKITYLVADTVSRWIMFEKEQGRVGTEYKTFLVYRQPYSIEEGFAVDVSILVCGDYLA